MVPKRIEISNIVELDKLKQIQSLTGKRKKIV